MVKQNTIDRIASIDILRSISMLWIVAFWHMSEYINIPVTSRYFLNMTYGVLAVFFLISGYLQGGKSISTFVDAVSFYKSRFLRLCPLFFISAVSFLLMFFVWETHFISSIKQFILTITGLGCFILPAPATIWFVCVLFVFYISTPPILKMSTVHAKVILAFLFFLTFVCIHQFTDYIDPRVVFYFPFYIGGLLLKKYWQWSNRVNLPLLLGCGSLFWLFIMIYPPSSELGMYDFFQCILFCIFIIQLSNLLTKSKLILYFSKIIGYSSMCAYLFHRQFFFLIPKIIGRKFTSVEAYLLFLPLLILLSWLLQSGYDKLLYFLKHKSLSTP